MKTLTVTALLCVIMALTTAAALPEETPGQEPIAAHPVVKRSAYCAENWTQIGCRCFRFIPTEMTWAMAERNCLSLGGHLASIHNAVEYHDIQKLILNSTSHQPPTWIGGSDAQEESIWFWSDGTHFDFTMWGLGEPDNNKGQQYCLQINWGAEKAWDDVQCWTQIPSVCVN